MAIENYINDYSPTVGGSGISSGGTSLTVSVGTSVASGFRILVGTELMLVTAGGTTTTWTVTRGVESTTAASHSLGDIIHIVLTATAIDNLRTQWSGVGTYANLPASGMKSGDQYRCTDAPYEFVFDGSNWQAFAYGKHVYVPTWSGSATWKSQDANVSVTTSSGMFHFESFNNSTPSSVYWKSTPATPYKIHALFEMSVTGSSSISDYTGTFCGLFVGNGSSGNGTMWVVRGTGDPIAYNVTAGNTNFATVYEMGSSDNPLGAGYASGGLITLAIEDDGSTRSYGFHDGRGKFLFAVSHAHSTNSPDHIGIYITTSSSTNAVVFNLISWHEF